MLEMIFIVFEELGERQRQYEHKIAFLYDRFSNTEVKYFLN